MERNVSMDEISDGRLYGLNDMVKADCRDCWGCSDCCRDMGNSILLDPLDVHRLSGGLAASFEELMGRQLELNVVDGLVVYPKVIEKHVLEELPFMASENIMMDAVKRGGDRQELHERIRVLSQEAGRNVKDLGLSNNLIDLIAADPAFGMTKEELSAHMEPSAYIGRCPQQVEEFLKECVAPVLERYQDALTDKETELKV